MSMAEKTPGYFASDILEDVQGAVWDRIEDGLIGMVGTAVCDGTEASDWRASWLIITDSYGARWRVTVEAD